MVKKHRTSRNKSQRDRAVNFRALPSDVEAWRDLAERDDRTLASWIRKQLNIAKEKQNKPESGHQKEDQAD